MNDELLKQLSGQADKWHAIENNKTPEQKQHEAKLRDFAESMFRVVYDSDGKWRLNYSLGCCLPGSVTPISSGMRAEQVIVQLRGVLIDFLMRTDRPVEGCEQAKAAER